MRLIELPRFFTIAIDFAAWFVIHMGVAWLALHLPDRLFENDSFIFRCRPFERGGKTWDRLFHVRKWKEKLPDGSAILGRGFAKKRLEALDAAYFETFIRESRRAELMHWIAMSFAVLFFLWNPPEVGWFMILYAIGMNAPCIIAQRYNRPRFQRFSDTRFAKGIEY